MPGAFIAALCAVLILSLSLGVLVLIHGAPGAAIRVRVRGLSESPRVEGAELPSIRMRATTHGMTTLRIFGLLRFNPDIPREQRVAWPVVVLMVVAAAGISALVTVRIAGLTAAVIASPVAGLLAARAAFGWQQSRYRDAIFRQIPDALGLMVRAIRAGLPLAEALRSIGREMPSPTKEEFARVMGEVAIGRPVDAALMRLHERTGLTEYAFLAITLGLQSQTGGSLAETLENLSEMVRKRVAMAKRAQAMAGEAKAQAGLLLVLPFVAALAMSFIQPFYVAAFTQNPTGQTLALIGLGMMVMGVVTIRWLIRQAGQD